MDMRKELIRGLTSKERYIPYWYKYDKKGLGYFNNCLKYNEDYYFPACEKELLHKISKEILASLPRLCLFSDLGCGNAEKSMFLVGQYLKENQTAKCQFVPIDICEEIVQEVKIDCENTYGENVIVTPINGDFYSSIPILCNQFTHEKKLLMCFGSLQNLEYRKQIQLLEFISSKMKKEDDYLLLSLDVTQDKDEIEMAYADKKGMFQKLDTRGFYRLIEEEMTDLNLEKFVYEAMYVENPDQRTPGGMEGWIRSLEDQVVNIESLGLTIKINVNDKIFIAENRVYTYKYKDEHLNNLFHGSGLRAIKMWKNNHCAMILLQKMP